MMPEMPRAHGSCATVQKFALDFSIFLFAFAEGGVILLLCFVVQFSSRFVTVGSEPKQNRSRRRSRRYGRCEKTETIEGALAVAKPREDSKRISQEVVAVVHLC